MFTKEKCPRPGLRGLILKYYSQSFAISLDSRLLQCFFLEFPILSSRKVPHIIQILVNHLDPIFIDHLSPYSSAPPIRHPLWLSVSCGSQGSTVQESSPHKCGQKSSCSAFNAMEAAFLQIFLGSLPSRMLMRHIPITGASMKITFIIGIHI